MDLAASKKDVIEIVAQDLGYYCYYVIYFELTLDLLDTYNSPTRSSEKLPR